MKSRVILAICLYLGSVIIEGMIAVRSRNYHYILSLELQER